MALKEQPAQQDQLFDAENPHVGEVRCIRSVEVWGRGWVMITDVIGKEHYAVWGIHDVKKELIAHPDEFELVYKGDPDFVGYQWVVRKKSLDYSAMPVWSNEMRMASPRFKFTPHLSSEI